MHAERSREHVHVNLKSFKYNPNACAVRDALCIEDTNVESHGTHKSAPAYTHSILYQYPYSATTVRHALPPAPPPSGCATC